MHATTLPVTFERQVMAVPFDVALRRVDRWLRAAPPPPRMDLEIEPWSSSRPGALLVLRPQRKIHPTERYFREGHAFLDQVVAAAEGRLVSVGETPPGPRPPGGDEPRP